MIFQPSNLFLASIQTKQKGGLWHIFQVRRPVGAAWRGGVRRTVYGGCWGWGRCGAERMGLGFFALTLVLGIGPIGPSGFWVRVLAIGS
ncbi:hypothetical protein V6Z11_A13G200500 [Gossypium hirsutum]